MILEKEKIQEERKEQKLEEKRKARKERTIQKLISEKKREEAVIKIINEAENLEE